MSYANRGMGFEQLIELASNQYRANNIAEITKVPTPVKILNNRGGRVTGFVEKKGTVDFEGTIEGGKSIAFDAKQTKGMALPLNNIHQHQLDYLEKVDKLGGIAFILVNFSDNDLYYRLDIKRLLQYIERPYETNKKSIPIRFFMNFAENVKNEDGICLNYLKGLDKRV